MGRYSAAVKNKNVRLTTETFQDGPKSYLGPPRESRRPRQSGTVGMRPSERKNKTNFYVLPLPLILPSRSSSDLAAHFSRGIRHYLETPSPPLPLPPSRHQASPRRKGTSLLLPFLRSQDGGCFGGKKEVDFTLRIVHDSFLRASSVEFKWSSPRVSYYRPVFLSCRFRLAITDISRNVIFPRWGERLILPFHCKFS